MTPTLPLTAGLARNAKDKGGLALSAGPARMTWYTLHGRTNQFANALLARETPRGERIAVMAPNCWQWAEIALGILRAAKVLAPLSPDLDAAAFADAVKRTGATSVVHAEALRAIVDDAERLGAEGLYRISIGNASADADAYDAVIAGEDETACDLDSPARPEELAVLFAGPGGPPRARTQRETAEALTRPPYRRDGEEAEASALTLPFSEEPGLLTLLACAEQGSAILL